MSYLPIDVMTGERRAFRRLKTFNEEPSFKLGTQFRVSYPITVSTTTTTNTTVTLKLSSSVDFELIFQSLSTHQSGITLRVYRSEQGSEAGSFDATVPIYKNNFQSKAINYNGVLSITTGGSFTVDAGQEAVETINVLSSGFSASSSTGTAQGKRGLGADDYYVVFSKLDGAGVALGVYSIIFNENP
jgi:hypothetical protein